MFSLRATRDKAGALLRRFGRDRSGNVMMFFGLALVPVLGLAGAAMDYARATTARAQLNAAVDSAALMAARDASKLTDAQLRDRINGWIKGTLSPEEAAKFTGATIGIDRAERTVTISARVPVEKTLFKVINGDDMVVASNSQSSWGMNTIELALVLDNTGSMKDDNKMVALKAAAKDLITIMKDTAYEPDQIRISIVPFSARVLLDTSNKDASWLRYNLQRSFTCYDNWGRAKTCYETITKALWTGCVADRDRNYDIDDTAVTTSSTTYPADFCDAYSPADQAKILPLTSNWTALTNRVDAMTPVGATNVTIGAVWGMATLSPAAPFTEAKPANTPRLKKFMILLTDGDNTKNRFEGNGSTSNPNVDKRTELACASAKAAGISVYTIRVINGNADLLRNCASDPSMYYDVKKASELRPVFNQIAREISAVRLTH